MSGAVTILLVEDDADQREATLRALHQVCDPSRIGCANDGAEALDYLFARGAYEGRDANKQPRLVILDLSLPRLHGLDVLRAMRADPHTVAVPVVVFTASVDKAELDQCYRAGANSVVRKAADAEDLSRKMRQVHDFWITVNEADRPSRV